MVKKIFNRYSFIAFVVCFVVAYVFMSFFNVETKVAEYSVKGMTCKSCEIGIKETVSKVKGVTSVEVFRELESVKVTYVPEKTSLNEVVTSIEERDYTVTPSPNNVLKIINPTFKIKR